MNRGYYDMDALIEEHGDIDAWNKNYSEKHTKIMQSAREEDFLSTHKLEKLLESLRDEEKDVEAAESDIIKIKDCIEENTSVYGFTTMSDDLRVNRDEPYFNNILVIVQGMSEDKVNKIPSSESLGEFLRTYYSLDLETKRISDYINSLGYRAYSRPSYGGCINYTLAAYKAGIGSVGKSGLLLTSEYGAMQRVSAVFTNINNLKSNRIKSKLCIECNLCVTNCPEHAIYSQFKTKDNQRQYIDISKCTKSFSKNFACGVCIKVCPVNKLITGEKK